MKKILHLSTGRSIVLYIYLLISFGLLGCAKVVPVDNRILLDQKENSQGNFKYGGLTVEYSYRLAGGNMILDGQVDYFGDGESLDVRILFLDATGNILQQKVVYSSGYGVSWSRMTEHTFHKTLVLPPETTGISFSYSTLSHRPYLRYPR